MPTSEPLILGIGTVRGPIAVEHQAEGGLAYQPSPQPLLRGSKSLPGHPSHSRPFPEVGWGVAQGRELTHGGR